MGHLDQGERDPSHGWMWARWVRCCSVELERVGGGAGTTDPVAPLGPEVDLGRVSRLAAAGTAALVLVVAAVAVAGPLIGWLVDGQRIGPVPGDGGPGELGPGELAEVVSMAAGGTVVVSSVACGRTVAASGVLVGEGLVVTNRHVVAGDDRVDIGHSGQVVSSAPVVGLSSGLDAALLAVGDGLPGAGVVGAPLELADGDPDPGEPVVVAASWGEGFQWMPARVQAVVDGAAYGSDGSVLLVDVPTVPGYSGGPVLDRRGQLVGVLRSVDVVTALSVAIPASELSPWLQNRQEHHADSTCMND